MSYVVEMWKDGKLEYVSFVQVSSGMVVVYATADRKRAARFKYFVANAIAALIRADQNIPCNPLPEE